MRLISILFWVAAYSRWRSPCDQVHSVSVSYQCVPPLPEQQLIAQFLLFVQIEWYRLQHLPRRNPLQREPIPSIHIPS